MIRIRRAFAGMAFLAAVWTSAAAGPRTIAITIDDLPLASTVATSSAERREINARILSALKKHQAPAVGFVNEQGLYRRGELDAGVALLDDWLDAGMELGNHSFDHVGLWDTPLTQVQDSVLKGEVVTRWLTTARGLPLRYYRHPYTQTGRNEDDKQRFEAFLAAHGYQVAPMTVEHDDFFFSCVYDRLAGATQAQDRRRVADDYLHHLDVALDTYETMSQELFGRQIAQILLIHDNRLNADSLDRTLARLKERGYTFVTLEEALKDPAYRSRDLASGRIGSSWLARWARERHQKLSVYGQPDPQGWVVQQHELLCKDQ